MSTISSFRSSDTGPSTQPSSDPFNSQYVMSEEDELELQHLNAAVERITSAVPTEPYIVTVPNDPPIYRYFDGHFGLEGHCEGALFDYDESQLQYSSFVLRDHEKTLFMLQSKLDQERERRARDQSRNGHTDQRPATTPSGVPRKKLTLGQYKAKKEGKLSSTPTPKLEPTRIRGDEPQKDTTAADLNSVSTKIFATLKKSPATATPQNGSMSESRGGRIPNQGHSRGRKRCHEDVTEEKSIGGDHRPSEEKKATKKLRASSSPHSPEKRSRLTNRKLAKDGEPESVIPHGLPPMISPTLPPSNGDSALNSTAQTPPWGLPPMLSSELPESIEAQLRKLSASKNRPSKDVRESTSDIPSEPYVDLPATKRTAKSTEPPKSPKLGVSSKRDPPRSGPTGATDGADDEGRNGQSRRRSLIATLKFSKAGRNRLRSVWSGAPEKAGTVTPSSKANVARIKKAPNHSKERHSEPVEIIRPPEKVNAKNSTKLEVRVPEKLSQSSQTNGPSSSSQPRPSTPPALITPTINTPASAASNAATPSSIGPPSTTRPISRARSAASPEECEYWKLLSQQYSNVGRQLKRSAGELFVASRNDLSSREFEASLLLSLECIMAFMLSFYLSDYRRFLRNNTPGDMAQWKSLIPLWREFRGRFYMTGADNRRYSPLLGLHFALGVAIASHIGHVAKQVNEASKNERHRSNTANGAAANQNTWTAHLATPQVLHENHENLLSWSAKAAFLLFDRPSARFPRTVERTSKREPPMGTSQWFTHRSHRLKIPGETDSESQAARGTDPPKGPIDLSGDFWTGSPLGKSALDVVRVGVAMIEEWREAEGMNGEKILGW